MYIYKKTRERERERIKSQELFINNPATTPPNGAKNWKFLVLLDRLVFVQWNYLEESRSCHGQTTIN